MGYTKLFNEILLSTVWQEPDHVRLIWIALLAMKDERHEVMASVLGLSKMSNVPFNKTEEAIKVLSNPDHGSRSQEFEGRRIKAIDGGWFILNGEKYRKKMSLEHRREYQRDWKNKSNPQNLSINRFDSRLTLFGFCLPWREIDFGNRVAQAGNFALQTGWLYIAEFRQQSCFICTGFQ